MQKLFVSKEDKTRIWENRAMKGLTLNEATPYAAWASQILNCYN